MKGCCWLSDVRQQNHLAAATRSCYNTLTRPFLNGDLQGLVPVLYLEDFTITLLVTLMNLGPGPRGMVAASVIPYNSVGRTPPPAPTLKVQNLPRFQEPHTWMFGRGQRGAVSPPLAGSAPPWDNSCYRLRLWCLQTLLSQVTLRHIPLLYFPFSSHLFV